MLSWYVPILNGPIAFSQDMERPSVAVAALLHQHHHLDRRPIEAVIEEHFRDALQATLRGERERNALRIGPEIVSHFAKTVPESDARRTMAKK